jgi:hypothetical protein
VQVVSVGLRELGLATHIVRQLLTILLYFTHTFGKRQSVSQGSVVFTSKTNSTDPGTLIASTSNFQLVQTRANPY